MREHQKRTLPFLRAGFLIWLHDMSKMNPYAPPVAVTELFNKKRLALLSI
jgi:hypothetical protein